MAPQLDPILEVALAAAAAGEAVVLEALAGANWHDSVREKAHLDFATAADVASESAIIATIRHAFPEHRIVGEETGAVGSGEASWTWFLDPLDGTSNFVRGRPEFAISIAAYEDGEPRASVIRQPVRDATVASSTRRRWQRPAAPDSAAGFQMVAIPGDVRTPGDRTTIAALAGDLTAAGLSIRITGALAYDLADICTGVLDGRISTAPKDVDVAAAVQPIEQAGGSITDFAGDPWRPGATGLVAAATSELHGRLLSFARRQAPPRSARITS